uniref:Uncharacterized protein n=1 Tax=viral metagenome TaxID=1070528 RepID=A0A6C0AP21_9ZZZZ
MLQIALNATPSSGFKKVALIVRGFPKDKISKEKQGLTEK